MTTFNNLLYCSRYRVGFIKAKVKSTGDEITFGAMGGLILHSTRCVYGNSDKRDDSNIFVVSLRKLMNILE